MGTTLRWVANFTKGLGIAMVSVLGVLLVVSLMVYGGYKEEFAYMFLVACLAVAVSIGALGINVQQARQATLLQQEQTSLLMQVVALLERLDGLYVGSSRPSTHGASHLDKVLESHPRTYEPWSSNEDQRIKNLVASGQSIGEIASALERQPSEIRRRMRRSGIQTEL